MKEEIDVFDYSKEILSALNKGVLLTTKSDEKVNSMVIGWGLLGIEWGKPIFTAFVRKNRFTNKLLRESNEFTINIPINKDYDKKIIALCGTKSGRDIDKIKDLNLTLVEPSKIDVPGIKEFPLTLECKVIYKQDQDLSKLSKSDREKFYPADVDSSFHGANKDFHSAFYGEIVSAYIIE